MNSMKIGAKLQVSNILLIITVLLVTAVSFHFLSARYLLNEARVQLREDSQTIIQSMKEIKQLSNGSVGERLAEWKKLRNEANILETKIAIFSNTNNLIFTNIDASDIPLMQRLDKKDDDRYLIVRRPLVTKNGDELGRLLLVEKIEGIVTMNRLMRRAQDVSLVIGGILSIGIGYLLGRHVTRPIRSLAAGMRKFSPKKEIPAIHVRSRDEVGELADSFLVMASKLRQHESMQTDFLQNASHELKTPLMAIQGNAEAVLDGIVQGDEAKESLEVIVSECQRLKTVVNELIYLTKMDHIEETFRMEPMAIGQMIDEALTSLQGMAEQKGVVIEVSGDVETTSTFDREKLKRAFINIIGNGIRYANQRIDVLVVRDDQCVEISCSDDGKGFSPGEENRIFERFYKGEQGGTGIGLSITKSIVEAHGGTIVALSNVPYGAVIRMRLPLRVASEKALI